MPTPNPTATPPDNPPTATPEPEASLPQIRTDIGPHAFGGTATIDAAPASDGTVITAWVSNFQSPVGEGEVTVGIYFLRVFQHGNESFAGKTITFKVGSFDAPQIAFWETLEVTELNLTADQ